MLSVEQNEFLTRVGAGAPAGQYLRRIGLPALRGHELPQHSRPITQTGAARRPQASRICDRSTPRRPMQSRSNATSALPHTTKAECAQMPEAGLIRCQPNRTRSAGGAR